MSSQRGESGLAIHWMSSQRGESGLGIHWVSSQRGESGLAAHTVTLENEQSGLTASLKFGAVYGVVAHYPCKYEDNLGGAAVAQCRAYTT